MSTQGALRAAVQHPLVRAAADRALRRLDPARPGDAPARHPLSPAAVRVERARSRRGEDRSDLTAVTVWFGQGPALPGAGGSDALRTAARIGSTVVGAVAFAALTAVAARREESRGRVLDGAARESRLG